MVKIANKVTVVGTGLVGSTIAYTLAAKAISSEVVLVDVNAKRAEGEAMDIQHGSLFSDPVKVYAGDYQASRNSNLVIITAGTSQHPGESRMALVSRNASIVKDVARNIKETSPDAIIIVVSNPVDVMTRVIQQVTGFDASRVIGSGTNLDTSRFRNILSQKFGIDSHSIHGYILGEHGDSEFPAWSLVDIAGMNINQASDKFGGVMQDQDYIEIGDQTKNAAYEVIDRKGATYYAIAASSARIAKAVLRDENAVLPLSVKLTGQYGINDVYLSLPAVIGQNGIVKVIDPNLSDEEAGKLRHSADILESAYQEIK